MKKEKLFSKSGLAYVALIVTAQTAALNWNFFTGAAHSALLFLTSFAAALPAIFWPGLRPAHPFLALAILLPVEGFSLLVLSDDPGAHLGEMTASLILQALVSSIVAIGLWMRLKSEQFVVRRAAGDEEEQGKIFELKNRIAPEEGLTFFRYRSLMGRGMTLVGSVKTDILCCAHFLLLKDTLYLHDLLFEEGAEGELQAFYLLRMALSRRDLQGSEIRRLVALASDGSARSDRRLLEKEGFRVIASPEETEAMKGELEEIFAEKFPDWHAFGSGKVFLELER